MKLVAAKLREDLHLKDSEVSRAKQQAQADMEEHQRVLQQRQEEIDRLQEDGRLSRSLLEELEMTKKVLQTTKTQLAAAESVRADPSLKAELEMTKKKLAIAESLRTDVSASQKMNDETQASLREQLRLELRDARDQLASANAQVKNANDTLQKQSGELKTLQNEKAAAEVELQVAQLKLEEHTSNFVDLSGEREALTRDIARERSAKVDAEEVHSNLREVHGNLLVELESTKEELTKAQTARKEAEAVKKQAETVAKQEIAAATDAEAARIQADENYQQVKAAKMLVEQEREFLLDEIEKLKLEVYVVRHCRMIPDDGQEYTPRETNPSATDAREAADDKDHDLQDKLALSAQAFVFLGGLALVVCKPCLAWKL